MIQPDTDRDRRLRVRRGEAARILGISVRQLDYRVGSGEIRTVRDGRAVLFPMTEVRRYAVAYHPPIRLKPRLGGRP